MPDLGSSHRFEFFPSLAALPEDSARLWRSDSVDSYFLSRGWFDCLVAAGLDPGDAVAIGALQSADGRVLALLPARFTGEGGSKGRLRGLTGMYACLYRPILSPEGSTEGVARSLGLHLGQALSSRGSVALDALDAEWPGWSPFESGLRAAGFSSFRYAHFGNWSEPIGDRSFEQYLAARPGALREIVRRRQRALAQSGVRYAVIASQEGLDEAIADYEAIYARSWKPEEPYPRFHDRLMRVAAGDGALRLGLCYVGEQPAAAQIWIVWRRVATVLKLAHDQAFDRYSPGSVLLAHMIRHVLERDAVAEIDFGRGDDPYKRDWATRRRQRIGLHAVNPRSPAGIAVLLRHYLGRGLAAFRGWRG
ncbi:MAG TPA: GNAT family N-acetyltransferase [Stellaceae bacterium]|nr:GNAT family N-acetyltransferase [Stellaceae bacterium]